MNSTTTYLSITITRGFRGVVEAEAKQRGMSITAFINSVLRDFCTEADARRSSAHHSHCPCRDRDERQGTGRCCLCQSWVGPAGEDIGAAAVSIWGLGAPHVR